MAEAAQLGFGIGLRPDHYEAVLADDPAIDWFEIISENYMVEGGKPLHYLDRIRARYPIVMHGVSLSIGGTDPLDFDYLRALRVLAGRVEPAWISDHLCWTSHAGVQLHDLLPLPFTEEAARHVAERVSRVQDFLGRRILLENVSSYVQFNGAEMAEWEFLAHVAESADCLILLDVNNVYVSGFNHGFDPFDYLRGIPADRVAQFHVAGHTHYGTHIIDTHDHPVARPVWDVYAEATRRFGPISTLLERDDRIPALEVLVDELGTARAVAAGALETVHAEPLGA